LTSEFFYKYHEILLFMRFEAENPLAANHCIVDNPRGQIQSVSCIKHHHAILCWQAESDGTVDHVDDLIVAVRMCVINIARIIRPGIRTQTLI
jgi:hypothetical protein